MCQKLPFIAMIYHYNVKNKFITYHYYFTIYIQDQIGHNMSHVTIFDVILPF